MEESETKPLFKTNRRLPGEGALMRSGRLGGVPLTAGTGNRMKPGGRVGDTDVQRLRRSAAPKDDPLLHFREQFVHWMYDETQDPYAQRCFRQMLRTADMKLRLDAWKIAATVLSPATIVGKSTEGSTRGNVAINFVSKIARPAPPEPPTIETEKA